MRTLLVAAFVMALALPAFAEDDAPRNKVTGPPSGHPRVWGRASDELRRQAQQLRMRAMDQRDAADDLREHGRGDKADDLDERAEDLEDRAHTLETRADELDTQGENAGHGMVLPAPSPGLP